MIICFKDAFCDVFHHRCRGRIIQDVDCREADCFFRDQAEGKVVPVIAGSSYENKGTPTSSSFIPPWGV